MPSILTRPSGGGANGGSIEVTVSDENPDFEQEIEIVATPTFTPTSDYLFFARKDNELIFIGSQASNTINWEVAFGGQFNIFALNQDANIKAFGNKQLTALFAPISATGGTITDVTIGGVSYRVHVFDENTSPSELDFVVSSLGQSDGVIEFIIVAGGGGGGGQGNSSGHYSAGGGGAGGYISSVQGEFSGQNSSTLYPQTITVGTYPVSIGSGGLGGNGSLQPTNGGNSSFNGLTAIGGGAGGSLSYAGQTGGSGGGAGFNGTLGLGTSNQGYNGGSNAGGSSIQRSGGGGGGAGQLGQNAIIGTSGDGGNGIASSIDGTSTYRAGGGGGAGPYLLLQVASGGLGGGGDSNNNAVGQSGLIATGGGGGASAALNGVASTGSIGGNGGSGIVIIRYKLEA